MTPISVGAIRQLPKVELHCHLEGAIRGSTLVDLARQHEVQLPSDDPAQIRAFTGFDDFFKIFRRVQSVLRTPDDWYRLAYESTEDAAASGIRYRECFVTPAACLEAGVSLGDIVAGIAAGFDAAEVDLGVRSLLIVDADRAFGPAAGLELMEALAEILRGDGPGAHRVIGAGMDGAEDDLDPRPYAEAFALARSVGLRLTAHQGGEGPASHIRDGIEVLGCERVDHGLTVLDDADLLERCRSERIPFTVCPTSNLSVGRFTSLAEHPFRRMRDEGLLATLHTDDPGFVGNELASEYALMADALGLSWEGVVELAVDAITSSWMDDAAKAQLTAEVLDVAAGPRGSEGNADD